MFLCRLYSLQHSMELRAVTQLLYTVILVDADGLTAHLNDTCFLCRRV